MYLMGHNKLNYTEYIYDRQIVPNTPYVIEYIELPIEYANVHMRDNFGESCPRSSWRWTLGTYVRKPGNLKCAPPSNTQGYQKIKRTMRFVV